MCSESGPARTELDLRVLDWGSATQETSGFGRNAQRTFRPQEAHLLDGVASRHVFGRKSEFENYFSRHSRVMRVAPFIIGFGGWGGQRAAMRDSYRRTIPARPTVVELRVRRPHLATCWTSSAHVRTGFRKDLRSKTSDRPWALPHTTQQEHGVVGFWIPVECIGLALHRAKFRPMRAKVGHELR